MTYKIVAEVVGKDDILLHGNLSLPDAERLLTTEINNGHDAYLEDEV
jgi:hypothetical protein